MIVLYKPVSKLYRLVVINCTHTYIFNRKYYNLLIFDVINYSYKNIVKGSIKYISFFYIEVLNIRKSILTCGLLKIIDKFTV